MLPDDEKNLLNNISQLKWACRRGMLELDVLLGNFLQEAYPGLTMPYKKLFVELLNCSDPELFAWLINREPPGDKGFANMTEMIRLHAKSRI